jgi:hypothetical protein
MARKADPTFPVSVYAEFNPDELLAVAVPATQTAYKNKLSMKIDRKYMINNLLK